MGLDIMDILLILLIVTLIIGGRNLLDLPHAVVKSVKELKRRPQG